MRGWDLFDCSKGIACSGGLRRGPPLVKKWGRGPDGDNWMERMRNLDMME